MAYYDTSLSTALYVDASPVGLGAILVQTTPTEETRPIAYASRALTPTEQRYSHIEKEAIAILWGCRHFHLYLYGASFTVFTDHKPLLPIFQGSSPHPPARIEKWLLHLQQYDFALAYQVGADNQADFLSRHPRPATVSEADEATETEEHICQVVEMVRPKAVSLETMREATCNDSCCDHIKNTLLSGAWKDFLLKLNLRTREAQEFLKGVFTVRHELSISADGLLLRGACILVQPSLQDRIVALAHEGLVRTKARIRRRVWFPHLDDKVEELIATCLPCQTTGSPQRPEPICTAPRGKSNWEAVSADFCTVTEGTYLLVVIDDFSRYPEVEIVRSTAPEAVLPALENIFATHGLPLSLKSDNGPPFQGKDFANYLNNLGINHHRITPRWPQANGDAERFMRTLNKVLRVAKSQSCPWELELFRFLRNYRTTPHASTATAPAELMFGGLQKTSIPHHISLPKEVVDPANTHRKRLQANKNMSERRGARPSRIRPGDHVLVLSPSSKAKLQTQYDPLLWTVIDKKGSMISTKRDSTIIT